MPTTLKVAEENQLKTVAFLHIHRGLWLSQGGSAISHQGSRDFHKGFEAIEEVIFVLFSSRTIDKERNYPIDPCAIWGNQMTFIMDLDSRADMLIEYYSTHDN